MGSSRMAMYYVWIFLSPFLVVGTIWLIDYPKQGDPTEVIDMRVF